MVFVGSWEGPQVEAHAAGRDPAEVLRELTDDPDPDLWGSVAGGVAGLYVFRCPPCSRHRGHWDMT